MKTPRERYEEESGKKSTAIEIDPANPDTVFCGADLGVYVSHNAGGAWAPFNNGLPNALVKDLAFHPVARLLRAGTQSRGVWEIAVDAATIPDVEIYLRDSTVDTGRLSPSPSGVNDPFLFGAQTFWWQCKDIKVDGPTFQRPTLADVDFEAFSDDQSLLDRGIEFAAGLTNENPQRNRTWSTPLRCRKGGRSRWSYWYGRNRRPATDRSFRSTRLAA